MKSTRETTSRDVEVFQLKKLFRRLESSQTIGSVITIVLPPNKSIHELSKKLVEEVGLASNIKDKRNRQSVIEANTAVRDRIKNMNCAPKNGLLIFSGRIKEEGSKSDRMIVEIVEPFKPISHSTYSSDSVFRLDVIKKQLLSMEAAVGFIIVDGNGSLFATL